MGKKLKRNRSSSVKTVGLLNLLRRVHLAGAIGECVVTVTKGKGKVEAVDMTNSIICIANGRIASKKVTDTFGLGNLELLIKFLSTIEDDSLELSYTSNTMILKRQDGRRKLEYLLTAPELVATNLRLEEDEDEDPYDKMNNMMEYKAELTGTLIKDFLKFIGLLNTKDVRILFNGEDELTFKLGAPEEHQIELALSAEVEGEEECDAFEVIVNGEHLSKVFGAIDYDSEDPPTISFADGKPLLVESGDTAWFLLPLTGEGEYEEEE